MRVIESMKEIRTMGGCDLRVWRVETELLDSYDNEDLVECYKNTKDKRPSAVAAALAAMPRVSAVEVKRSNGDAVLISRLIAT